MKFTKNPAIVVVFLSPVAVAIAQMPEKPLEQTSQNIPLTVQSGVPLRVYLTKRLTKRAGEPVEAKLLEPLFAFDRAVAPAGSEVLGQVSRLKPVPKMKRAAAILGGDFTPLHEAEVQFTTLVLPDGRRIPLQTLESIGLNSIVPLHPPKPPKHPQTANGGVLGTGKRQAQAQIQGMKDRVRGVADMVRGPNKKEALEDFLVTKLPYHPQWVRRGTRFDAELNQPLQFGAAAVKNDSLRLMGTQPPPDSIAHVRLLTALDSGSAKQGDEVKAVLSQPLFSPDNKLILPEGTRLTGALTVAHRARWFHRGGQLRFNFQRIDLPEGIARPTLNTEQVVTKTQATLESAESSGKVPVKVDSEGGVKASESKTRFIAPAISVLIATRSADDDTGHIGRNESNAGGRTLGGVSGFGVVGAAVAQSSPTVGMVFGYYGMVWSVYANIIARGAEVEFDHNAAMDIRFGGRPRQQHRSSRLPRERPAEPSSHARLRRDTFGATPWRALARKPQFSVSKTNPISSNQFC